MKRTHKIGLVSGAVLAAVAFTTVASAADLPTRKAPPSPYIAVVPFSWTGFYVGATAGATWGSGSTDLFGSVGGVNLGNGFLPGSSGSGDAAVQLGGEVGYNYQIGNMVLGVEDDIEWMGSNKQSVTYTGAFVPALGGSLTTNASSQLDWLGTTRARLGYATMADDRLLLYVTGGLAYGGGSSSVSVAGPAGASWYASNSPTQVGWTVGGGAEYAFTNNWTVKAEYLYYDLGSYTYTTFGNGPASSVFTAKVEPQGSIARVGVNYKF